jgi:hypothetical protein
LYYTFLPSENPKWSTSLNTGGFCCFTAASDTIYQLLVHGRWFSPGTPASSTTKTGRHDIAAKIKVYFVIRQKLLISEVIKKDRQYNSKMRKNTKKQTIVCKTLGLFSLFIISMLPSCLFLSD